MLTPETTKPSHCCEGFVLYGAAPGVEIKTNLLFLMVFKIVNLFSILKITLNIRNVFEVVCQLKNNATWRDDGKPPTVHGVKK